MTNTNIKNENEKKPMAKRTALEAIASGNITVEVMTWVRNELDKMDEANAKRKDKPSKTALANQPIKEAIFSLLTVKGQMVASDIATALTAEGITFNDEGISTSKASALCRQMVEEGRLTVAEVKIPKKGKLKAYTAILVENEDEDAPVQATDGELNSMF